MSQLSSLKYNPGAKKNKKRVGRGTSSGWGKTCGRGHKGQKSRSGGTKGVRFEGGQTPLYRRLPKRGFKNYPFKKVYSVLNVSDLNKYEGEIDKTTLKISGLLKILGNGEIMKAITIKADKFSGSAQKKIEAAGGKCLT
ncbi:50S ribosomal protein L15 [candidate division WOR-1 bacterium RIFCSPLOWO2_02_FULL_46_20]|uniref:Large ribosomal subunit protein uL15 n=1 Tax=candidate division WOR-1 bacterium RIFCSPLOWO2_02_FULL_46_20 TaxID=1802567 RepID=A0A1F4R4Z2_UNCSA|nr:MAG: 50S ribosomal protein L15 [candidate division WOR-1 bacterium RIFCSPHIGHO2_02_FULL_45_12]OGC03258.1 MAG: 50S ribosomal protein L15 [candidate division WOR-1 bacterium RIFCSPLOWO2_02_FULL_46_20]